MSIAVPADGVIVAYSQVDAVGRIQLTDGTVVRFGRSSLRELVPAEGLRVRVEAIGPHPLGGFRALVVTSRPEELAANTRQFQAGYAAATAAHHAHMRAESTRQAEEYVAKLRTTESFQREAAQAREAVERARSALVDAIELRRRLPPREALRELLRQAGASAATVDAALTSARDAALLIGAPVDAPLPPGGSKLGGRPDAPPAFAWPVREGRPLAFLAQLRLGELPEQVRTELALPADGLLSFFYDVAEQPGGTALSERGAARVCLFHAIDELAPVREGGGAWVRPELAVRARLEPVLPDLGAPAGAALALDGDEATAYEHARSLFADALDVPRHRVGGFADPIQDAIEGECARVTGTGPDARWRLLLQLDYDERAEMEWGDNGVLYFALHDSAVRAGAFERTWCLLQSH